MNSNEFSSVHELPRGNELAEVNSSAGELTDGDVKSILRMSYEDPVFFCNTFFKHIFTTEIPWLHRGVLAILTGQSKFLAKYGQLDKIFKNFVYEELDDRTGKAKEVGIFYLDENKEVAMRLNKYIEIIIPRGGAKTTLCNIGNLYNLLFQNRKFLLYLSESATHAEAQLANLRGEFEANELLKLVFGALRPERSESAKWTDKQIEPKNGSIAAARGTGGQVRGINIHQKRPDLIIVDDVQNEESVTSSEQREKTVQWFYRAVIPCLAPSGPVNIVALGTVLHKEALLMILSKDKAWTTIWFGALDKDGDAIWDISFNAPRLKKIKESMMLAGQLAGFYLEFHSVFRNDETAIFREQDIQVEPDERKNYMAVAIAIDPAISSKRHADASAFAVVGVNANRYQVFEVAGKVGMTPREQIDFYFELCRKWRPTIHGIEAVAYQQALVHLMKEEMMKKSMFFEIIEIRHGMKKEERIKGVLQPRYRSGMVFHQRHFSTYINQLLDFPQDKDDFADAAAMAVTLLTNYQSIAANFNESDPLDQLRPLGETYGDDYTRSTYA